MERKPYKGAHRKLVIGIDIGTTFSGVSYSVLEPGLVPEIKGVTKYPAQENIGGDSKIPSIVYYDHDGSVMAIGAEAISLKDYVMDLGDDSEERKPFLSEWFKLHLRPQNGDSSSLVQEIIPPLPPNKTALDVFTDFLQYLAKSAREFIEGSDPNGAQFWKSFGNNIDFVLSHPNGWEGPQQDTMRKAAIRAGLIPDDDESQSRLQFVTEGEASLHACLQNGLAAQFKDSSDGVIVIDMGGGTIDITAYSAVESPDEGSLTLKELVRPTCEFMGSIFVTRRAAVFLKDKIAGSKYEADLDLMAENFDSGGKHRFINPVDSDPTFVKFGTHRDNDPAHGIRNGQLKIPGNDVAGFFEPSVKSIIQVVEHMRSSVEGTISTAFLVGGFAASDYVFSRLQESFATSGLNFCRPDSFVNKAVADGAVSFYIDHIVTSRISRMNHGIKVRRVFDTRLESHRAREADAFTAADGLKWLKDGYSVILPKDTQISETKEFREPYYRTASSPHTFNAFSEDILTYRGNKSNPHWMDEDIPENFGYLCSITANTSALAKTLQSMPSHNGYPPHYRIDFDIVILFGLTEMKAFVAWQEDGVEKRGPAKIIYTK